MPVFPTPHPILVTLEAQHADARFVASERADTRVTVRGHDEDDPGAARIEFSGGELVVRGARQRRLGWAMDLLRGGEPLDLEIALPAGSRVHAKVAMGGLRCEGPLGECRLDTRFGDIRVDSGGPLQLTTAYGEVHVGHATGDAEVSTRGGGIRVGTVDGAAVIRNDYGETRVGAVTGDLRIDGLHGEIRVDRAEAGVVARTAYGGVRLGDVARGGIELSTTSGELEVGVRAGTAAWLDLVSTAGRVRSSLRPREGPDGFTDTVEIRARTHDGDIHVHRA